MDLTLEKCVDPQLSRTSQENVLQKTILSRWTEDCSELYNYESYGVNTVLGCIQRPEILQPILREEVEIAAAAPIKGSPQLILVQGGETMTGVLTKICNKIWKTGEWPGPKDSVADYYIP